MFKFELGALVRIVESGESGTVQGRAQYADCADQFQVSYRGADGVARIDWFFESRLLPFVRGLQGPDPMAGVEVKANDVTRRMLDLATGGGVDFAATQQAIAAGIPTAAEVIEREGVDVAGNGEESFPAQKAATGGGGGVDEAKPAAAVDGYDRSFF